MDIKTIKNIDSETWKKFKLLANEEGVKMGVLLKNMINAYEKKKNDIWGIVFEKAGNLTKREGKDFEKDYNHLRKEEGFRV